DYARGRYNYGVLLTELGKIEAALPHLRYCVEREPGNPDAHFALGNAQRAGGDQESAAESRRPAIELKPDYVDADNNLALPLAAVDDLTGAVAALETACQLRPMDAQLWTHLGQKLSVARCDEAAIIAFDRALVLAPDSREAIAGRLELAWR